MKQYLLVIICIFGFKSLDIYAVKDVDKVLEKKQMIDGYSKANHNGTSKKKVKKRTNPAMFLMWKGKRPPQTKSIEINGRQISSSPRREDECEYTIFPAGKDTNSSNFSTEIHS